MKRSALASILLVLWAGSVAAQDADPSLVEQELHLADVMVEARRYAKGELDSRQRIWRQRLLSCAAARDSRSCLLGQYRARIAELEARYQLKRSHGPERYVCPGATGNVVEITSYDTDPRTAIVTRDGQSEVLYYQDALAGDLWATDAVSVWQSERDARVRWAGYPDQRCVPAP